MLSSINHIIPQPPFSKDKIVRRIFEFLAGLLLLFMLQGSKDAGISGDEEVHYQQSVKVYNYFATLGHDQSALDTPVTHLKYYGQSFDNLTTILIRWFHIDDIYTFRHVTNTLAAWLAILLAAYFAIWLSGYGAGILTLLLFALSPTFLGHAQNNLKDIPFALAYLAGTFFLLRWLFAAKPGWKEGLPLVVSMAFCISIRPGGLLLICYFLFFTLVNELIAYRETATLDRGSLKQKLLSTGVILLSSWLLSLALWPYALQNPVSGLWESYKVMAQFPTTIRQIFEGRQVWSDLLPWYYLPKMMLITIPLLVWAGLLLFVFLAGKAVKKAWLKYAFLIFTLLFPVLFVIWEKSNLYGSWRHFLFVYPGMVVLAAIGWEQLLVRGKTPIKKALVGLAILVLAFHPFSFLVRNHPYYYLYYNQFVGGLKGAYGNYETDYYYHTLRQGSEWLINYLHKNRPDDSVKVGANFPVDWFFRKEKKISAGYFQYNERSQHDWDYYIVANSYLPPYLLKNNLWPPRNSLKVIEVYGVPVCAVLKRETKDDFLGYQAYKNHQPEEAVKYFESALQKEEKGDPSMPSKNYGNYPTDSEKHAGLNPQFKGKLFSDEIIFFNFAAALCDLGDKEQALQTIARGLAVNPESEPLLMFQANLLLEKGETQAAADLYRKLIALNPKSFDAYVALAKIWTAREAYQEARALLKSCLVIHPSCKAAITGLADTYRKSDPEIAKKYDELAKSYP